MTERMRLDDWLVASKMVPTKSQARSIIMAGKVFVNGKRADKAGFFVKPEDAVEIPGEASPYVSRGGVKLSGALDHFAPIVLQDRVALDIGASTGGFTDCLLQRGVKRVYALDVGYGQLAWKLRTDARVVNIERTNFRYLAQGFFPEPIEVAVADLSFISLEKILPSLRLHLAEVADCVFLIKPQFEVGREGVGAGGVVRDPLLRLQAIERVIASACDMGFDYVDGVDSSLPGPKGNVEFLAWFRFAGRARSP